MNKKSFSRDKEEKAELKEEISNDISENRLQADQQVAKTDDAIKVEGEKSSFSKKTAKGKGSELKQAQISDVITGSSSAAGMGISAAGRSASGTVGGVLGASSSVTYAGKSRNSERVGKKLDRTATKLNYTPCESSLLAMDESKPLADAAADDQGFNGTYRNEDARSQKIMGAVPADLMFQRSVDYVEKDKLYFVEGQMDYQNNNVDASTCNPTVAVDTKGVERNVSYHSGNYVHRKANFWLDKHGKVKGVYFDVDDISPSTLTPEDANMASAHRLIKEHVAELDRINMDAKAGDEKADLWSPLPRAIEQPTAASYLMSSIEADTGAFVHLAYAKATTCMSHQLNRGVKDGLDTITPALENVVGWRKTENSSKAINTAYNNNLSSVFNINNYRAGDPSLMIAAYDSVNKYKNKADLLLQPRGYRMHLQTADNNINPLRLPKEYLNVFTGQEVYSTIDHEYDPILPICITDKANLVTVHNLNELSGFVHNHYKLKFTTTTVDPDYEYTEETLLKARFIEPLGYQNAYVYIKQNNSLSAITYNTETGVLSLTSDNDDGTQECDIIILGKQLSTADLAEGGEYYGYALIATYAKNAAFDLVLHVPTVQDAADTTITSVSFIEYEDKLEYKDAGQFNYSYSDLRNNYIVEVKHPLVEGMVEYLNASIGGKIQSLLNDEREMRTYSLDRQDVFELPLVFSTKYMTLAQLFICAATPWITRVRLNSMKDVIYFEDNIHEYPYSKLISLKEAPFKAYVNFNYSDYDNPIECKVMNPVVAMQWVMPEFCWKVGTEKYVLPWYFNEVDLTSAGDVDPDAANMSMPSIRSGIRLGLLDQFYGMSEKDIRLSLDRMTKAFLRNSKFEKFGAYKYGRTTDGQIYVEIGSGEVISLLDILSAPRELGLCMDAPLGYLTKDPADSGEYKALTADGTATSFRIQVYVNEDTPLHPSILASNGVNISRATNYKQVWYELTANNATSNTELCGLVFGINDEPSGGQVAPFAAITAGASSPTIYTYQRALWTRLQLLPFIISPFDAVQNGVYSHDIYDFAYMFGLAGFRASDYRESVYNREKEIINQGIMFIEDPWILDSPIIKYAAKNTGASITRGYEA